MLCNAMHFLQPLIHVAIIRGKCASIFCTHCGQQRCKWKICIGQRQNQQFALSNDLSLLLWLQFEFQQSAVLCQCYPDLLLIWKVLFFPPQQVGNMFGTKEENKTPKISSAGKLTSSKKDNHGHIVRSNNTKTSTFSRTKYETREHKNKFEMFIEDCYYS